VVCRVGDKLGAPTCEPLVLRKPQPMGKWSEWPLAMLALKGQVEANTPRPKKAPEAGAKLGERNGAPCGQAAVRRFVILHLWMTTM
jgi:hypothetical protein